MTLLAGPPKVGKSWMALALGLDIATGRPALGSIATQLGPVLYLALEDTPRRPSLVQRCFGRGCY